MFSFLKDDKDSFIIAEVGQNHQGDIETAKKYIRIFADAGADAIKFQTRNNRYLFSNDAYTKTYDSENSFANTYGEHREKLELKEHELEKIKEECLNFNVKFMSTAFDEPSLDLLCKLEVDAIKIASFDIGNLPFIDKIAKTSIPVVISTGGGLDNQIKLSIEEIQKYHSDLALLHCVSEYPCPVDKLGLSEITNLSTNFPNLTIGLSDHFNGISTGPIAYLLGARVFEKHVTLDRSLKGTDHSFSLTSHGFSQFVRDIKRTPKMLPSKPKDTLGKEKVFQKLGKSIVAASDLKKGDILTLDNLSGKIFNENHVPVRNSADFVGARLLNDINSGDPIELSEIAIDE